jgi:arsenate reductase
MAEGFLKNLDSRLEIYSAGTKPEAEVNPNAVRIMKEEGIDISSQKPKNADLFKDKSFDYVITVCDSARESCPVFTGDVKNRIHIGFEDPALAKGSDEEILAVYRKVRDEIKYEFGRFYETIANLS